MFCQVFVWGDIDVMESHQSKFHYGSFSESFKSQGIFLFVFKPKSLRIDFFRIFFLRFFTACLA